MSLYDAVRDLSLVVEGYELEGHEVGVASGWIRKTTLVRLHGGGREGLGEDVTYHAEEHDALQARGPVFPLAGEWTLDTFSRRIATLDLFDHEPAQAVYRAYRRWGFESAALDLALRQAGRSLAEAVGRAVRPVTFVVSGGLGDPPGTARVRAWLDHYTGLRFKLDATPAWTADLVAELRELDCVDSIDLKGQYSGTTVDTPPDPVLYRLVAEGFPEAWLEDPAVTDETRPVLEPVHERVTWDAPIHSVADIESLPWPPRTVNVKPSRFGSVERLLAAYEHCASRGIRAYGGGQFELDVGRGQIQLLAALFHPDMPNDVAPGGFNLAPAPGLPASPLELAPRATGFALE